MKFGAWIHDHDEVSLEEQIEHAAAQGLRAARSYHLAYAERAAPALHRAGMSLFAGLWVDSGELARDWRSQLHLDEIERYHEFGLPLDAICVGNELRENGDEPDRKRFTARLAFGLANLISTYRSWMEQHGYRTPLTYAIEEIAFDHEGAFHQWLWPLIDVCDAVAINSYPMSQRDWFTFEAFDQSRRFLSEMRARNDRLVLFEARLRRTLQELERVDKPLILSETGFPSAVGYQIESDGRVVPENDNLRYGQVLQEFLALIHRVNADYNGRIQALYFYEWRDNLYHYKITNVEQSPIHVAFGLCDQRGVPKLDIKGLLASGENGS